MSIARWLFLSLLLLAGLSSVTLAQPVGKLTVDGIHPGMSYAEVVSQLGRPKALSEKRGLIALVFAPPAQRKLDTQVWFSQGKVVYCSGYTLLEDEEPLHLYGLPGGVLVERFGPLQPLSVFASWWPDSGVVLAGSNHLWPDENLRAPVALRALDFPLRWAKTSDGKQYSESEPWVDDESIGWMAEDVELGMSEEKARKLAGSLDVVYRGGFVQAIKAPNEALLLHRVGHHDFSVTFEVGQAPEPFGPNPAKNAPPNKGWFSPTASGRVRMVKGKVAEIQLGIDAPELFSELEKLKP